MDTTRDPVFFKALLGLYKELSKAVKMENSIDRLKKDLRSGEGKFYSDFSSLKVGPPVQLPLAESLSWCKEITRTFDNLVMNVFIPTLHKRLETANSQVVGAFKTLVVIGRDDSDKLNQGLKYLQERLTKDKRRKLTKSQGKRWRKLVKGIAKDKEPDSGTLSEDIMPETSGSGDETLFKTLNINGIPGNADERREEEENFPCVITTTKATQTPDGPAAPRVDQVNLLPEQSLTVFDLIKTKEREDMVDFHFPKGSRLDRSTGTPFVKAMEKVGGPAPRTTPLDPMNQNEDTGGSIEGALDGRNKNLNIPIRRKMGVRYQAPVSREKVESPTPSVIEISSPRGSCGESRAEGDSVVEVDPRKMTPVSILGTSKTQKIQGDGNCLFRAISEGLFREENSHMKVRKEICTYLGENTGRFNPFFVPELILGANVTHETYEEYVRTMACNGSYGGALEITAAAEIWDVSIRIFNEDSSVHSIWNPKLPNNMNLRYSSIHKHYDFFVRLGEPEVTNLEKKLERIKELSQGDTVQVIDSQGSTQGGNRTNQEVNNTATGNKHQTIKTNKVNGSVLDGIKGLKGKNRRACLNEMKKYFKRKKKSRKERKSAKKREVEPNSIISESSPTLGEIKAEEGVFNLSSFCIKKEERNLLQKGLTFCPGVRNVNRSQLQVDLYNFARNIRLRKFFDTEKPDDLNKGLGEASLLASFKLESKFDPITDCKHLNAYVESVHTGVEALAKANSKTYDNLTYEERKALRGLLQKIEEKEITLALADKGGGIVMLDFIDYKQKGDQFFAEQLQAYVKVEETGTKVLNRVIKVRNQVVKNLVQSNVISVKHRKYITFNNQPKITGIKFLPKIHKSDKLEDIPLRPIHPSIGSPNHQLSQVLDALIKPLVTHTNIPTLLRDTNQLLFFCITQAAPGDEWILLTSDVTSLYTNIPHDLGVKCLKEFLGKFSKFTPSQIIYVMTKQRKFVEEVFSNTGCVTKVT